MKDYGITFEQWAQLLNAKLPVTAQDKYKSLFDYFLDVITL